MSYQPLVITPAQARYIAEYLDQEFNISQKNGHGEGRWSGYDLDYAIMDAVQAIISANDYLETVHVHLNKVSLNIFDDDNYLVIDVWEKDFEGSEPLFTFEHFIQEDE